MPNLPYHQRCTAHDRLRTSSEARQRHLVESAQKSKDNSDQMIKKNYAACKKLKAVCENI